MFKWLTAGAVVAVVLPLAFLLFMVFGIPALIMLPFLLSGFIGRR